MNTTILTVPAEAFPPSTVFKYIRVTLSTYLKEKKNYLLRNLTYLYKKFAESKYPNQTGRCVTLEITFCTKKFIDA